MAGTWHHKVREERSGGLVDGGAMFQYAFVRFVVASLLIALYGMTDTLTRWLGWNHRPPRVRLPAWSHLVGFVSMLFFYGAIGNDGRAVLNGQGNDIGVALALLAIVLRAVTRRGSASVRDPDLVTRVMFFAALPLVVGSPKSLIALTLPQAVIAIQEALQREQVRGPSPTA
jgi:hypothetical protein